MPDFKGRITRIVYRNENFCIFSAKCGAEEMKCKGTFVGIEPREHMDIEFTGSWQRNEKYGNTLNVTAIKEVEPNDVSGITRYLEANVKGVGWITANRIAEHFGENTVKILTEDPKQIHTVTFLTDSQKDLIYRTLTENSNYRDVSVFLMSFDVSPNMVESIYKKWGNEAIQILTEDPYVLMDIRGIGFKKADEVATRMGIDPRSPVRIKAVIRYILEEVVGKEGHLFVSLKELQEQALKLLDSVSSKTFSECLDDLVLKNTIVLDNGRVYSSWSYNNETGAAMALSTMVGTVSREFDVASFIEEYERIHSSERPFKFSPEQVQAIYVALTSKVMVLTGLPGTGKTTLLKAVVNMFDRFTTKIALMAPTGIASKKLKEATGRPTGTIHRILGCKGDGKWDFHESNPHPADLVIVDEFSMVDMSLFYKLLQGIREDATLILVGDVAQLPSVGPGHVLNELIGSGVVPVVSLSTIHRQEEASDIILNAHRIQRGESLIIDNKGDTDFKFIHLHDDNMLLDRIRRTAKSLHDRNVNFQCLSPRHDGLLGVSNLNECLRDDINPDVGQDSIPLGKKSFRIGDRVMVTRNRYEHKVFNGDIGTVIHIDRRDCTIQFQIDEAPEPTVFKYGDAQSDLVLAYCITCHKSQGSQWDVILLPIVKSFSIQLVRNLFYTAITRAKKKVLCYGQMDAADKAIRNNRVSKRNTIFGDRLKSLSILNS